MKMVATWIWWGLCGLSMAQSIAEGSEPFITGLATIVLLCVPMLWMENMYEE